MNDRDDNLDDDDLLSSNGKDDGLYPFADPNAAHSDDVGFDDGEGDLCPDFVDNDD